MSDIAIAGMVVMGLGCVCVATVATLAICYARTFIGRATKDGVDMRVNTDPPANELGK